MRDASEHPSPPRSADALTRGLLELFAKCDERPSYLAAAVALLRSWSGCQAAGVRVLDEHREIPYEAMQGFDTKAWPSESRLRLEGDACLCTRVVAGRLEGSDAPLAMRGGGVHAPDMQAFLARLPAAKRASYLHHCHEAGYATLVVLPLQAGPSIVGALHLADPRPALLDAAALEALEAGAVLLGQAIRRYDATEALERSHRAERALGALRSAALSAPDKGALLEAALHTLETDGPLPVVGASVALHEDGRVRRASRSQRCVGCSDARCPPVGAPAAETLGFDTRGRADRPGGMYAVAIRSPQGQALGVLRACTTQQRHQAVAVHFLEEAAAILGGALQARRTQAALRTSEERLALALDGDDSGVFDLSVDGDSLHVSGAFGRMLRRPPPSGLEEVLQLAHPDDRAQLRSRFRGHLAGHLPQLDAEARFEVAGGGWRRVHICGRRISQGSATSPRAQGPGASRRVAGTFRDVTEARRLQEQLAVSDRLASIGTLAAGVAHELNNPLSYVLANVGYALEELGSALERGTPGAVALPAERLAEVTAALREAVHGAERVRGIVGDLRSLTRRGDEHTAVDVHEVLAAVVQELSGALQGRAALRVELSETPRVRASSRSLRQAFWNLLDNAVQALPKGAPGSAAHEVAVSCSLEGGMIRVRIRDTGVGMSEEVRGRIFEPFYTTRPVGQGTGLGLSVTYSIVRELGGRIDVESAPGQGSTFTVLLPPVAEGPRGASGS